MKILVILTYYAPHWTGLTVHAVRVAEGLAARGHEVTVLTTRHAIVLPRDETLNGVRVVRLQPAARFSRGMIAPAFLYAAPQLIAQHDVVQIHSPIPEALYVALCCKLLRRPLLMTHHGDIVMPEGSLNQLLQRVAFYLLRGTGWLADAITSYSRDYAEHSRLLKPFEHKLAYIYPPVEMHTPDPDAVAAWRAELGLTDRRIIGFAGRWVEEKGFDYLLEAAPLVREAFPETQLVYAGQQKVVYEDFYSRCQPLIEAQRDYVTFLGLLRDPQRLANFYAMCDLFAQPSRTDMLGLVQVEAMLTGTPVVVSDIPGARVVVQETGYGRLAPPHDPASLAETIIAVLRSPDDYRPERAEVQKLFDTDRALTQYETLLQRIAQKSGHFFAHHRSLSSSPLTTGSNDVHPPTNPLRLRRSFAALTAEDQERLANILRNEADMAYRRRAFLLLDYMELQDSDRVLDCGCGMGFYLMTIGKLRQAQLTGVDDDLGRLHWAQRENVPAGLIRGDINHMSFPDATFDKVLLSEVLEHVPDEGRVLRELYRTLKPGGILAISVPHAHFPFWWDPLNGVWTGLGGEPFRSGPMVGIWTNHERLYTREELVRQVQAAGFEIELVEETTHYSFPFIHYLVYGIGKPLLEQNLLPPTLRKSADRFSGEVNSGSLLNPINLGLTIFRRIDRLNDDPAALEHKHTFVNVLLKARKPTAQPDTVNQRATVAATPR